MGIKHTAPLKPSFELTVITRGDNMRKLGMIDVAVALHARIRVQLRVILNYIALAQHTESVPRGFPIFFRPETSCLSKGAAFFLSVSTRSHSLPRDNDTKFGHSSGSSAHRRFSNSKPKPLSLDRVELRATVTRLGKDARISTKVESDQGVVSVSASIAGKVVVLNTRLPPPGRTCSSLTPQATVKSASDGSVAFASHRGSCVVASSFVRLGNDTEE
jgi:hypothetical protein